MSIKWMCKVVMAAAVAVSLSLSGNGVPFACAGEAATDVCALIPGDAVAEAVKGRIKETRSDEGRCVYMVTFENGTVPMGAFVIYRHAAGEYGGLRQVLEGEVSTVEGVGDEAVMTFDAEAKRYWLLVVKRGQVTLQVSGDDPGLVRRVAELALQKDVRSQ